MFVLSTFFDILVKMDISSLATLREKPPSRTKTKNINEKLIFKPMQLRIA